MQLGFVSAILGSEPVEKVIDIAAEVGYGVIEVGCWPRAGSDNRRYAGTSHIDVANVTRDNASEVKDLFASKGVGISALGYYPNPLAPDPDEANVYIEHLKKVILAAEALEIHTVCTFIGRDWRKSVDENWPRFLETWKPLIAFAEDHGRRIAIENCPMLFSKDEWPGGKNLATTPAIWRRMFNDIPSDSFGLNYDPSHLVWQQIDHILPLYEFKDKLFHMHAKDCRLIPHKINDVGILATPNEYHEPKLPGLGEIDWGEFFSTLGSIEYTGPVAVEVEDRSYEDSFTARKASLVQSHDYLRNFMGPDW